MALWDWLPAGWEARPRKNQKPATTAITSTAAAETAIHVRFPVGTGTAAWLTCAGVTAAPGEEPEVLAAAAGGSTAAEVTAATGAAVVPTAGVLPDSVSRFNLCRSARKSAAC